MSRRDEIVDVAEWLLEAEGADALTMRRLGDAVGMRAASLYKHVAGKDDITAALQERALRAMGTALAAAGPELVEVARAYRGWAREHPRLYQLATRQPLARDRLAPGVEAAAAEPLLRAVHGDRDRARALWAVAHGLVDLELAGRFPPGADVDAAWASAVAALRGDA